MNLNDKKDNIHSVEYIRTDEELDTLISLRSFIYFYNQYINDELFIKWLIVSLHNTLQGFMILALRGTNSLLVYTDKSAQAWLDRYENNKPNNIIPKLDSFLNLYKKVKSERMKLFYLSKVFTPTESQNTSIKQLNNLRNDFVHFLPKNWSIQKSMINKIIIDCFAFIFFLLNESGNIIFHKNDIEKEIIAYMKVYSEIVDILS